jgi:phenylacetate-CoA ligase
MISRRSSPGDLKKTSTSGSTGENIFFYQDRNCRAYFLGNMLRQRRWMGVEPGELEVMIWGSAFDLGAAERLTGRLKAYFANVAYISAYGLNDDALAAHIATLRRLRPPLITGYASALYVFARYMLDRDIRDIRPRAVISSAEMLYAPQRACIERVFGCRVFDRYGCREFATIAHECGHGGKHITMERLFVEVAGEEERQWGVEPGELIITDLDNFGMPMIRYCIGDMGGLEERTQSCPCGRGLSLMKDVSGRSFDLVRTPTGSLLPGTFWTILTRAVPGIVQFQVVQKKLDEIELRICTDSSFPLEGTDVLRRMIQEHCGLGMNVVINVVDHIAPGKTGKFRYVISEIGPTTSEKTDTTRA